MHFLKCMAPLPLNSSISFPPASSNQLWSPAHCPHSSNIGLHAKTQPNICDFGVFVDSIMCKTVLHTFYFCLYTSRQCDISLRAVRVQEPISETVSLCLSASTFYTISSWHPSSLSPPGGHKNIFASSQQKNHMIAVLFFDGDTMVIFINSNDTLVGADTSTVSLYMISHFGF